MKLKRFKLKRLWLILSPMMVYFQVERVQLYLANAADFKMMIAVHGAIAIGLLILFIDAIPGLGLPFLDKQDKVLDSDKVIKQRRM